MMQTTEAAIPPPKEPAKFLANSNEDLQSHKPGESNTKNASARIVLNTFVSIQDADSRSLSG